MKAKFFMIVMLMLSCFVTQVFACNYLEHNEEKEYISAEQIMVKEDGLYVLMQGVAIPVSFIAHDAAGLYCFKMTWTCPRCKTVNSVWNFRCAGCGYSGC